MQEQIEHILALYEAAVTGNLTEPETIPPIREHTAKLICETLSNGAKVGDYFHMHKEDAIRRLENPEEFVANAMENMAKNPLISAAEVEEMVRFARRVASEAARA